MSTEELDAFCEMYSEINLPFWMQTRPETVNDYNIRKLSEVGLHRITFGIEHGNEKFRREVVDRNYTNESAISALKNPVKLDIPFSINKAPPGRHTFAITF